MFSRTDPEVWLAQLRLCKLPEDCDFAFLSCVKKCASQPQKDVANSGTSDFQHGFRNVGSISNPCYFLMPLDDSLEQARAELAQGLRSRISCCTPYKNRACIWLNHFELGEWPEFPIQGMGFSSRL